MNNQQEVSRFEFLLTLDNNIICQRYFNVRELNKKAPNSIEFYEYITDVCDEIALGLKKENFLYMTDKQRNYDYINDDEDVNEKGKNYLLEIKLENRTVMSRTFPANIYHPKVRYTVDIRPKLKGIISELTYILSTKKLKNKYLKYDLA